MILILKKAIIVLLIISVWGIFKNHADAWIQSIPPTLTAIAGIVVLIKGQHKIQTMQQELHLTMNSRLDELVKTRTAEARLAGAEQERQDVRDREKKITE